MKIVATTSLPAVDRPNADRWNAARSRQFKTRLGSAQENIHFMWWWNKEIINTSKQGHSAPNQLCQCCYNSILVQGSNPTSLYN